MSVVRLFACLRVFSCALFCALVVGGAHAQEAQIHYRISLAGLQVGKATLVSAVKGADYDLKLNAATVGLATSFTKGSGAAAARGAMGAQDPATNGFSLSVQNGHEGRTFQVAAAAGAVRQVTIEPPFPELNENDRVPLQAQHKTGIIDPLSAFYMPVRAGNALDAANCARRLPIFDGMQRFDVVLTYAETRQVKGDAYSGPVLVCNARYVPVAGHRPEKKMTKFMAENKEMSAWLMPVHGGKALLPYRISVKTLVGTSVIEAEKIQ